MTSRPADRVESLLEVFSARMNHEHELIAQRMTWLMALNGFLAAAVGLALAGSSSIPQAVLRLIVVGLACLGAASNCSCLFSNYWADRAQAETTLALYEELNRPSLRADRDDVWRALRMHGRDPDDRPLPAGFWRPPTKVLHPWFLLPILFGLAYLLVPLAGLNRRISNADVVTVPDVLVALVPLGLVAVVFVPLLIWQGAWRRREQRRGRADRAWQGARLGREVWERTVFVEAQAMPVREVRRILGSGRAEARAVLEGVVVPHERHWAAFEGEATRTDR